MWSNGWAALLCSTVQLELRGQIQLLEENGAVNDPKNELANTLLQTNAPLVTPGSGIGSVAPRPVPLQL